MSSGLRLDVWADALVNKSRSGRPAPRPAQAKVVASARSGVRGSVAAGAFGSCRRFRERYHLTAAAHHPTSAAHLTTCLLLRVPPSQQSCNGVLLAQWRFLVNLSLALNHLVGPSTNITNTMSALKLAVGIIGLELQLPSITDYINRGRPLSTPCWASIHTSFAQPHGVPVLVPFARYHRLPALSPPRNGP